MTNTQIIALLVGGCIGLVLAVPAVWGIFKYIDHRDATRVERWLRKQAKKGRNNG